MRPRDLGLGELFERIGDAAIVADAKTQQIVLWNPAATNIFGYSASEALGLTVEVLVPEYLKDRHRAGIARYGETGRGSYIDSQVPLELPALRKGGQKIYVELSLSSIGPVSSADEEHFVLAIVRDITERKWAEQEVRRLNEDLEKRVTERTTQLEEALARLKEREQRLQESEERYRSFIEQSTEGIWRFKFEEPIPTDLTPDDQIDRYYRHGYLAECNDAMARIYGYLRAEELVGARLDELLPRSVQRNLDYLRAFIRSGYRLTDVESEQVGHDTKYFLNNLAGNVESGALVQVWGTQRDITERKKTEEAVKQSELLYYTVIEQATENIFLVEVETRLIVESNSAFQETLGYTQEELRSMTLYDIVAADQKSVDVNIRRNLEQRRRFIGERKYRRKDGSLVNVEVSASVILRNGRETLCVVAHDITERKKTEETQRFLAEASASLSSSLDYRATLARMARLAVPRLADWCAVDVLEEDGSLERLAVQHEDPRKVELAHKLQARYPPDPDLPQGVLRVVRDGQAEFYPEITDDILAAAARDAEHLRLMRKIGFTSAIIMPLAARGRTLGAITLVSAESGRRYRPADVELAEELARRAALAVDNARLYQSRGEVVRTLQQGLLPSRLPEVPGVEVGLRYETAGEVDVGGDFYDLFDASTTYSSSEANTTESTPYWGVVIGDVCGKGAEAAAVLALARYTIRAAAIHKTRPSAILADLNETMLTQRREHNDYKFCTIAYARLETQRDAKHGARAIVSRAGHPAPILLKADGSIQKIGDSGRVIGVFDDPDLTEQEVWIDPGDALVLYTDGVIEARSPDGTFFGEERLVELLRSSVGLDASTLAEHIEGAVLNFQDNTPRDDIAVLVLRIPN